MHVTAPASTMMDHLGIKITSITADGLEAEMPVTEKNCQVHGFLNGGASLAMCESCAGAFSREMLKDSGRSALGVQVSANHLKTARIGETVTCRVTPVRLGHTLHVLDARIFNARGDILCRASVTNMVVDIKEEPHA